MWPHGLQHTRCPCPSPITSQVKLFIQWPRIAESFPKEEKSDLKEKQNATSKLVFLQNEGYLMPPTPVLWPPDAKSWLIGKDSDAGRDWGQEEKGTTEDEMAGWPSLTQWTWVSVKSGSWWWTGRPGVLRFMGSQKVGHDWATELNWTDVFYFFADIPLRCSIHFFESEILNSSINFIELSISPFISIKRFCFWLLFAWYFSFIF